MPVATHVLSGDFSGLVGDVTRMKATVHHNSTDGSWVYGPDDVIYLGGTVLGVATDGTFTATLPTSTGTGLQYEVRAEYVDPATWRREVWTSGWFDLTASADLAERAENSTLRVNPSLGAQLAARTDGVEDHGDVSGAVSIDPDISTHWLDATGATVLTLEDGPAGDATRYVSVLVISGAEDVTVTGLPDAELTNGAFATFSWVRGTWILASSGAASTDTTPPTAVTDLSATGGAGEIDLAWSASTDAESTVSYRYRAWLTSGGASGAWTTTTATTATITGLEAGAYTAEVYAYSAGGSTTPDTDTATVTTPPGWNIYDSLTTALIGANGDRGVTADFTTTGGRTWRTVSGFGNQMSVASGKIKAPLDNGACSGEFVSGAPAGYVAREMDFDITLVNGSYTPEIACSFSMTTGAATIELVVDWEDSDKRTLRVKANAATGFTATAGPGYNLDATNLAVDTGLPATGRLRVEPLGQLVKAYIDGALVLTADFTNAMNGGNPNPLVGAGSNIGLKNGAAVGNLEWETYTS